MLHAFLEFHRATLLWKLEGLNDEQLRRPMTGSGVSLLGVLKHSAWVERWWFQICFAGQELPMIWTRDDPDADWRVEPVETAEEIIAFYKAECDASRRSIAGASWHDVGKGARPQRDRHTLGWILTHMVEEVARHNGHADILREAIDGKTGE
jgi:uncharacterized damage-inducible protein DinB